MYNICINSLSFEWDRLKDASNKKKHGVSFEEALSVFWDDNALLFDDPFHSENEERFLIIGMSRKTNILTIVHCLRDNEKTIRIISARKATSSEKASYIKRMWR